MVNEAELLPDRIEAVLDWVRGVGADTVVLTAFAHTGRATLRQWGEALARANDYAARSAERDLAFALHTQPELWTTLEGRRPVDLLGTELDPDRVALEYDPSGAIMHGADPVALLRLWQGNFHAVHLRDGREPPKPLPYLPALPLGTGVVDWSEFLQASRDAAVAWYFLEMEVANEADVLGALASSQAHLAALDLPARGAPGVPV